MNILHRFTRKSLKENRSRTIVTIIGIVLSMALFTAVIEGAYSGQQFLVRSVIEQEGSWLLYESGLTGDQADAIRTLDGVADSASWQEVGWGEIGSSNEFKPYLRVVSVQPDIGELLAIHLIAGRMPEKEGEILLPTHLASNGDVRYQEGEELVVSLGQRVLKETGEELPAEVGYMCSETETFEEITDVREYHFTVVGFYSRLDVSVEKYECPGYTALTCAGGRGAYTTFYTLKHPESLKKWVENHEAFGSREVHDDLRRFYGVLSTDSYMMVLYGFAAVLVFLISFGSISLIYNSFSISVSERTRQFGILKSVGATNRQIRSSVYYEALVLAGIGIPIGLLAGCAGIGITLYLLRDAFTNVFYAGSTTQMRLVLHPVALLIAAAVCLVTTLISASIPARRAIRISPIDAIRQRDDVKLTRREVKTSPLTQKLFGFEGTMAAKNFRRNRRSYRSTVVSLFLSIVLFISASSFCAYLTDAVGTATGVTGETPDITYLLFSDENHTPDEVMDTLTGVGGLKSSMYMETKGERYLLPQDAVSPDFLEYEKENGHIMLNDMAEEYGIVAFLDDSFFREFCQANGLAVEDYFDRENPRAILLNQIKNWIYTEDGSKIVTYPFLDESAIPCEISVGDLGQDPGEMPEIIGTYAVGGIVTKPFYGQESGITLYYPRSMKERVLRDGDEEKLSANFYFQTTNHAKAYEDMKKALIAAGMETSSLYDRTADEEATRMLVMVVNVFSYGFIIIISLIAMANIFNTISTSVMLRRREFAMLRSIGMGNKGFRRMMTYECLIYGLKGIAWGLPASIAMTFVIWRIAEIGDERSFYIPWYSVAIAVGSVFLVVFITTLYAMKKLAKENTVDALKNENL